MVIWDCDDIAIQYWIRIRIRHSLHVLFTLAIQGPARAGVMSSVVAPILEGFRRVPSLPCTCAPNKEA
jgi:hypothetical protein